MIRRSKTVRCSDCGKTCGGGSYQLIWMSLTYYSALHLTVL